MKGLIDVLSGKEKIQLGSIKSSKSNLSFSKLNLGWRIKGSKRAFDFDRDGVPDFKDCEPLDRSRQHRDPGDWMETTAPFPRVHDEDWMKTTRYKRKPRKEKPLKTLDTLNTRNRLILNALAKYVKVPHPGSASTLKGKIEEWADEMVENNNFKWCPYRDKTIVIYDSARKVYHYFTWEGEKYYPELIFSVSASDRRKYGDEWVMKFVRSKK